MGVCWYCYWGWPKQVRDIYDKYLEMVGESAMHYGPAHIVWEDENFEDENIDFCLVECEKEITNPIEPVNHTRLDTTWIRESLRELKAIPVEIRCCEPADYQGYNPEKFPPPPELVMVK